MDGQHCDNQPTNVQITPLKSIKKKSVDSFDSASERLMKIIQRVETENKKEEEQRKDKVSKNVKEAMIRRMFEAIKTNDITTIKELIDVVNVDEKDKFKVSLLHHAASEGHLEAATFLISRGANVNCTDQNNWTPLHAACNAAKLEIVSFLLDSNADSDIQSLDGNTPLHYFVKSSNSPISKNDYYYEVLSELIKKTNLLLKNQSGDTPLHEASLLANPKAIECFFKYKDAEINTPNMTGETALHFAVKSGNIIVVQLLLDKGANFNISSKVLGTPLQLAIRFDFPDIAELLQNSRYKITSTKFQLSHMDDDAPVDLDNNPRDKYGFMYDADLEEINKQYEEKYDSINKERLKVWNKYLSSNNLDEEISNYSPQLQSLIRKLGIPHSLRGEIWHKICSSRKRAVSDRYYSDLLSKKYFPSANEIEKDIHRTFPGHCFFSSEKGQSAVRNVLLAYSIRNPSLGYCQSMNFIVGLLLLQMSEENSFSILCYIVEELLEDYFGKTMTGLSVDQKVLEQIIQSKFPKVHQKFESINFPLSVVTTRWFMCIFLNTTPSETTLRIWDCFLFDGAEIILLISFTIIKMNESQIESAKSVHELMDLLNNCTRSIFDCDALLKNAFRYSNLFEDNELTKMRIELIETIESEREQQRRQVMNLHRDRLFFKGTKVN